MPADAGIAPDAAVRSGRLATIRLPLFLFVLTEGWRAHFCPCTSRELVTTAGHAPEPTTLIGLPISVCLCFRGGSPLAGGLADRHGAKTDIYRRRSTVGRWLCLGGSHPTICGNLRWRALSCHRLRGRPAAGLLACDSRR